jgi:hypothetical protein
MDELVNRILAKLSGPARLIASGMYSRLSANDKKQIEQDAILFSKSIEVTNPKAVLYLINKYNMVDVFPEYVQKLTEQAEQMEQENGG